MCGIIASIRTKNVLPEILSGLRLLEYRGYDSAGIAGISKEVFVTRKTIGPTEALQNLVEKAPLPQMNNMIGHTRWATHGPVSQANTHPQMSNAFALVHNGIISNFEPLKKELQKEGFVFQSTTDTEVIVFSPWKNSIKKQDLYKRPCTKPIQCSQGALLLSLFTKITLISF